MMIQKLSMRNLMKSIKKQLHCVHNGLADNPLLVSEVIAKDLPVLWTKRQSLRRQNQDVVEANSDKSKQNREKRERKKEMYPVFLLIRKM